MSQAKLPWDRLLAQVRAAGRVDEVENAWARRPEGGPPSEAVDGYLIALARLLEREVEEALRRPDREAHSDGREPAALACALREWCPGAAALPALARCLARVEACLAAGVRFVEYEAQGGFPRWFDDRTPAYRETLAFREIPGHGIGAPVGAREEWAATTSWPDRLAAALRLRDLARWAEAEAVAERLSSPLPDAEVAPALAVRARLLHADLALVRERIEEADAGYAEALRRAETELPPGSEELRRALDGVGACLVRQERTLEAMAAWARLLMEESCADGLGGARARDRLNVICLNLCLGQRARGPLEWEAAIRAALDRGERVDGRHPALRPLLEKLAQRFREHGLAADAERMERWRG